MTVKSSDQVTAESKLREEKYTEKPHAPRIAKKSKIRTAMIR